MQITRTARQKPNTKFRAQAFTKQPAQEKAPTCPEESVSFSSSGNKSGLIMAGFGVSVVGLIAGAQMDNPAVMLGGFIGGMAVRMDRFAEKQGGMRLPVSQNGTWTEERPARVISARYEKLSFFLPPQNLT